jgi:membrane-associated phospholipid phosphatase
MDSQPVAWSTLIPSWLQLVLTVALVAATLLAIRIAVARHRGPAWIDPRRYRARDVRIPALVGAGLLVALIALALDVAFNGLITSTFDQPVHDWFVDHRVDWLTPIVIGFTNLAGPVGATLLSIALAVLAAARAGSWLPALLIVIGPAITALIVELVKQVAPRSRPPIAQQVVLTMEPSFPSGHSTGAFSVYGCFLVVLLTGFLGPVSRRAAGYWIVGAALLAIAVAVSRLYLGVHWFTDVTAGALLGGVATAATLAMYRELARRRPPIG